MEKIIKIACQGAATVPLDELLSFQGNLKDLSKENYSKLKKEILELGFSEPVSVWREKTEHGFALHLLNGHQRTRTLREMRDKEGYEVPAIPVSWVEADDLKQAKKKVLALTSQYGNMTTDGLHAFMHDAGLDFAEVDASFRFPEIDFPKFEVEFFKDATQDAKADEAPAVRETSIKPGDLFKLGEHRLLCGDSANADDVARLMDGEGVDMVFTDPPYGVSYQKKVETILNQAKERTANHIHGDDMSLEDLKKMLLAAFKNIYEVLEKKSSYYVCSPQGGDLGLMMMMMMQESGLPCRHMIIWVKNAPVFSMGRLDYDYKHEPILYGWSTDKTHEFNGAGEFKSSVWNVDREPNKLHPTMKPVAIPVNAILNSSKTGARILDLFGGSGTTLIASEQTKRRCFMMEWSPEYVQVIIDRWEAFTGKKAELISESQPAS